MSHSCLRNGLMHDLSTSHERVLEALEKADMVALEGLRKTSLEHLKRVQSSFPPESPEDYQALIQMKNCIDHICRDLGQKTSEIYLQIKSLQKTKRCLKAYKKK